MHLVHTYIAYRVSTSVVYIVVVYYTCRIGTSTCVCGYAHQPANAVSCRGGVYSYI